MNMRMKYAVLCVAIIIVALFYAGCGNASTTNKDSEAVSHGDGGSAPNQDNMKDSSIGFVIDFDTILHGSIGVSPKISHGEVLPKGTKIVVDAHSDPGYVLDSVYYSVLAGWGPMYFESMDETLMFTLNQDVTIGAAFLPVADFQGYMVRQDIVYAQPGKKPLKYDVFIPDTAQNLPLIVITHGGGWSSNDENIMRGMAREMVRTGRYVVASIDYRWIGNLDGDSIGNTMKDLIEDVYGAVLHIQEHAAEYGADPRRIALTGDSAGGHLTASMATMVESLGTGGFSNGVFEYRPTYLPQGMTTDQARRSLANAIRAVAPSYGVFGGDHLARFTTGQDERTAISPLNHVPRVEDRRIPHYLIRGTSDPLITEEMVDDYAQMLMQAGQDVKRVEVEGAGHAFFDWKPDATTRRTFNRFAVPYIHDMLTFFDEYLTN